VEGGCTTCSSEWMDDIGIVYVLLLFFMKILLYEI